MKNSLLISLFLLPYLANAQNDSIKSKNLVMLTYGLTSNYYNYSNLNVNSNMVLSFDFGVLFQMPLSKKNKL